MDENRIATYSIKVTHVSPVHIRFSVFSGMCPPDILAKNYGGRGLAGELTMRVSESLNLFDRIKPDLVFVDAVVPEDNPLSNWIEGDRDGYKDYSYKK